MTTCPNCGKEITPSDKFCSNCGTPLGGQASGTSDVVDVEETIEVTQDGSAIEIDESIAESDGSPATPPPASTPGWTPPPPIAPSVTPSPAGRVASSIPLPVDFKPESRPSVDEEWRMSSLGPPPKRKRSIWLYILIGILALCLLSCIGLVGFSMTDTGQRWIEGLATEAAQQATEAAG